MTEFDRFKVIEGGGSPSEHRESRGPGTSFKHECQICLAETGVATNRVIALGEGGFWRDGKLAGMQDALYCAGCFMRGVWTRLTFGG